MGGEGYTKRILVEQIFGRFAEGGKHFHPESFFFYFVRFPLEFLPWIVFLPTAIIFGFRKGKDKRKEFLFILIWFIFIFLFFSFSKGKKDNYLLPLYPAAAMMVGVLWDSGVTVFGGDERIYCRTSLAYAPFSHRLPFSSIRNSTKIIPTPYRLSLPWTSPSHLFDGRVFPLPPFFYKKKGMGLVHKPYARLLLFSISISRMLFLQNSIPKGR